MSKYIVTNYVIMGIHPIKIPVFNPNGIISGNSPNTFR